MYGSISYQILYFTSLLVVLSLYQILVDRDTIHIDYDMNVAL